MLLNIHERETSYCLIRNAIYFLIFKIRIFLQKKMDFFISKNGFLISRN